MERRGAGAAAAAAVGRRLLWALPAYAAGLLGLGAGALLLALALYAGWRRRRRARQRAFSLAARLHSDEEAAVRSAAAGLGAARGELPAWVSGARGGIDAPRHGRSRLGLPAALQLPPPAPLRNEVKPGGPLLLEPGASGRALDRCARGGRFLPGPPCVGGSESDGPVPPQLGPLVRRCQMSVTAARLGCPRGGGGKPRLLGAAGVGRRWAGLQAPILRPRDAPPPRR